MGTVTDPYWRAKCDTPVDHGSWCTWKGEAHHFASGDFEEAEAAIKAANRDANAHEIETGHRSISLCQRN